jgi:hypothetical protein
LRSRASKKWYKEKSEELKSDFPKEYFYGKNNIQGIKIIQMGIT